MAQCFPLLLLLSCFLTIILVSAHGDLDVIPLRPGENVILPCRSADPNIVVVQWTRPDLKPEYVFLSIDGHFRPEDQHPSFQGRVQLVHGDLKDGDVSLILKNVSSSDDGTYECRVRVDGSRRKKRGIIDEQPIRRVTLKVTDSHHGAMMDGGKEGGDKEDGGKEDGAKEDGVKEDGVKMDGDKKDGGHTFLYIGLAVAVLFLVCLVLLGRFLFRKYKEKKLEAPAAGEAERVELNMVQS